MDKVLLLFLIITLICCGCKDKSGKQADTTDKGEKYMEIKLTSSAFEEGGMIPAKYTCDEDDISPPLKWDAVPDGTLSIALISDDPDAPMGTWVHWVLYNLPPEKRELPENFPEDETLPDGTRQGITDFGKAGYGGPCPPSGTHRYYFKIYALDSMIDSATVLDKKALLEKMKGHILAEGQLMGRYKRR
jgi:Raf kinase inhibitor-like YbhB/YbcL family protein